jgi:hypothetical protein
MGVLKSESGLLAWLWLALAVLVAAGWLATQRYAIECIGTGARGSGCYVLDRWTGDVTPRP